MIYYPWEYTDTMGGIFKQWIYGSVKSKYLKQRSKDTVIINDTKVHSLIFESAAAGYINYARWDCVNGWTTTLREAKKSFPQGSHNKLNILMTD